MLVELPVDLRRQTRGGGEFIQGAAINRGLHGDMSGGLDLEVATARFRGEIGAHSAFDIDRKRIMALDKVGVLAIHASHEIAHGYCRAGGKATGQRARLGGQKEGEVMQSGPTGLFASGQQGEGGGARGS